MSWLLRGALREMTALRPAWALDEADWAALCQNVLVDLLNQSALEQIQRHASGTGAGAGADEASRREARRWLTRAQTANRALSTLRRRMETSFLVRTREGEQAVFALLRAVHPPSSTRLPADTHAACVWSGVRGPAAVLYETRVTVGHTGQMRTHVFVAAGALDALTRALYVLGAWPQWLATAVRQASATLPPAPEPRVHFGWAILATMPTPQLRELRSVLEGVGRYLTRLLRLGAFVV